MAGASEAAWREAGGLVLTRCPASPNAATLAHALGLVGATAGGLPVRQYIGADGFLQPGDRWLRYAGWSKPLWARSQGAETRLLAISVHRGAMRGFVRAESGIGSPADLAGRRVAMFRQPALKWEYDYIIYLQAWDAALRSGGLSLADVEPVPFTLDRADVIAATGVDYAVLDSAPDDHVAGRNLFSEIACAALTRLLDGTVDAIVGHLPDAVAAALGLTAIYDMRHEADPYLASDLRCLVADAAVVRDAPDAVAELLAAMLRAGEWAQNAGADKTFALLAHDLRQAPSLLGRDTPDIVAGMQPGLDGAPLELLKRRQAFIVDAGLLARPVDIDAWAAPEILARARALALQPVAEASA